MPGSSLSPCPASPAWEKEALPYLSKAVGASRLKKTLFPRLEITAFEVLCKGREASYQHTRYYACKTGPYGVI